MRFPRAAGILLHPTSLAGKYGIGDLGPPAFGFCEALAAAGQTYWQMLPVTPTGYGDSPYSSFSAFAGNTLLISPENLAADSLITWEFVNERPEFPTERVDYGWVFEWKGEMLRRAYDQFQKWAGDLSGEFDTFCREHASWLDDYALYRALKASQGQRPWFEWPDELRGRHDDALARAANDLADTIREEKFYQFLFFRQWSALKAHANGLGVKLIGDIPIFVALDSCDVWRHAGEFKLNQDGSPRVVAGVPPDYFSSTGQRWGNPICDWEAMAANGFEWWIARFRSMLEIFDIIRVDHFRGFAAAWEVPGEDDTAENGEWVEVPGSELFRALTAALGELPVIAEDLGGITPEVDALRDEFAFPGMRILEYGFGGDAGNRDLPHNYVPNTVAYTGTHDNDTAVGWFKSLDRRTRRHALEYLGTRSARGINRHMIRVLYESIADTVLIPMQDVLGLKSDARMNTPATTNANWQWRMPEANFGDDIAAKLAAYAELYGRKRS
ncbi:MAG: 4-alpha-glucanotransferase [Pyrinomonadaceae bacterium]